MSKDVNQLLKNARDAYKAGDRGKAARLIDLILRQDYDHRATWKLLYDEYGSGITLEEFRREFTKKYYPEKLDLLDDTSSRESPGFATEEKNGFLDRLTSTLGRPARTADPGGYSAHGEYEESALGKSKGSILPVQSNESPTRPIPSTLSGFTTEKPIIQEATPTHKPSIPPPAARAPIKTEDVKKTTGSLSTAPPQTADRTPKIRVMVVDDTEQTRETIIRSLSFEREVEVVATADTGIQAVQMAKLNQPDVIIMDINMPDMDGISATAAILEEVPFSQIVILTVQNDPDYMRRAMMAGARDFIAKPPALDDLLNAVHQAGKIAQQEKRKTSQYRTKGGLPASVLQARGKIITVYSPKGGAGCSMVTANLAAVLHNEETNVILVDSNLQFGDLPDLFNLHAPHTFVDLAHQADNLDYDIVEEIAIAHESGIKLLAPPGPEQAEQISDEQFLAVLKYLCDLYPYVLVNTTTRLSDITIAALEASDLIILLVTQDLPAITRAVQFLDTLKILKIDPKRLLVVLNQYDKLQEIEPDVISKSIKEEIAAIIPKDFRIVMLSINKGIPFMLRSDTKALPISRSILKLTELIRQRLIQFSEVSSE